MPPTENSFSNTSRQVLIGDVCQSTQIAGLALRLPSQFMSRGSNFAPLMP